MNEEPSQELSNIKVPLYCYHSKFFLVEELALEVFQNLHYGRCCVIGKLTTDPTDSSRHVIENIRLPSLLKNYSLPEGTIHLRTVLKDFRRSIPKGKICEIVGESILCDTIGEANLTAKDVVEKLNYLRSKNQSELEYSEFLLSRYIPAIAVDDIQVLERGHELAERNIEIRMLLDNK